MILNFTFNQQNNLRWITKEHIVNRYSLTIIYLFKRGIILKLLTGQTEVEWTHRAFLHQQCLKLQGNTMIHLLDMQKLYIFYYITPKAKGKFTWLLKAESLSFFPNSTSCFCTISFLSGKDNCPSGNDTVPFLLLTVFCRDDSEETLSTKQTP